jgi:hypothetical protein
MVLLTDITGIWCFFLIKDNADGQKTMMSNSQNTILYGLCLLLGIIYSVSYIMPQHYGIRCTEGHAPLGSGVLLFFYMFWTFFVTYIIRNDPLLIESLKETEFETRERSDSGGRSKRYRVTKDLLLSSYKGKFNYKKMLLA